MTEKICYNCFHEKPKDGACSVCGYNAEQDRDKYPLALPHGTILNGKYILGRVLGQGGFGITYVAQDWKTKKRVAVKEYLPDTMATRIEGHTVSAYSGQREEIFGIRAGRLTGRTRGGSCFPSWMRWGRFMPRASSTGT